jgi:acetate kinase
MNVLAFNCGSSTLKLKLFQVVSGGGTRSERLLATVMVDRVGGKAGSAQVFAADGRSAAERIRVVNHGEATSVALDLLDGIEPQWRERPFAVGHRVVHGGPRLREPVLLDDATLTEIESVGELAPLHNGPALASIRAARAALGPDVPMVATFDTAFHRTLPEHAARYALPDELASKHGIRRYGFHGLAHRYMAERYSAITRRPIAASTLITLQLGNGCSATAVRRGQSVDTSMGFTPLEGLMMGTRSGDVDPAVVGFLARREGVRADDVERWLNTKSGLLGVSGLSSDLRDLLEAERTGDQRAALALAMFCYRVRKCIGAYLAVLNGADAIVFGGGIGENAPSIRARICADMQWAGLKLDQARNEAVVASDGKITSDASRIEAYVVVVDEACLIARDTFELIEQNG